MKKFISDRVSVPTIFTPTHPAYEVAVEPLPKSLKRRDIIRLFGILCANRELHGNEWSDVGLAKFSELKSGLPVKFERKQDESDAFNDYGMTIGVVWKRRGTTLAVISGKNLYTIKLNNRHPQYAHYQRWLADRKARGLIASIKDRAFRKALSDIHESRKSWKWSDTEFTASAHSLVSRLTLTEKQSKKFYALISLLRA